MLEYAVGRLRFTLTGTHPVARCLQDEFAPVRTTTLSGAQLHLSVVDVLEPLSGTIHIGPLHLLADRYEVNRAGLTWQVEGDDGIRHARVLPLALSWKQRCAPEMLLRTLDWNHLTPHEALAKDLIYTGFDYLAQLTQLPLGQTFLHASSFTHQDRGVAVIGWGGTGKTSAMLKLVLEDGCRFVSDDLVAIDEEGMLWRNPKKLQVYAYNLAGQQAVHAALMRGRSVADRLAWSWWLTRRGAAGVRRRVSAEELLGSESVAPCAPLRVAIALERIDTPSFCSREMSGHELAMRAASALLYELDPLIDYSLAARAAGAASIIPTLDETYAATRSVLVRAFAGVQPLYVGVPLRAGPDAIAAFLRRLLGVGDHAP